MSRITTHTGTLTSTLKIKAFTGLVILDALDSDE